MDACPPDPAAYRRVRRVPGRTADQVTKSRQLYGARTRHTAHSGWDVSSLAILYLLLANPSDSGDGQDSCHRPRWPTRRQRRALGASRPFRSISSKNGSNVSREQGCEAGCGAGLLDGSPRQPSSSFRPGQCTAWSPAGMGDPPRPRVSRSPLTRLRFFSRLRPRGRTSRRLPASTRL